MTTNDTSNITASSAEAANQRYALSEHFMLREIAGESLIIPLPSSGLPGNAMITLNETSTFLLRLLAQPKTMDELIALAREEYDDPENALEANIRGFVEAHLKTRIICAL